MTTKELAEVLGVDVSTIQKTVKRLNETSDVLPRSRNGVVTKYTEEQATLIKQEIQHHHNLKNRQIDSVTTNTEIMQKIAEGYQLALQELEKARHKIEFYDAVTGSDDTIDMGNVAKILNIKGIGRNNLFEILRNKNVLQSNNIPYQKYVDRGYFRVIESKYNKPNGDVCINCKTVVYQSGVDFIRKLLTE